MASEAEIIKEYWRDIIKPKADKIVEQSRKEEQDKIKYNAEYFGLKLTKKKPVVWCEVRPIECSCKGTECKNRY